MDRQRAWVDTVRETRAEGEAQKGRAGKVCGRIGAMCRPLHRQFPSVPAAASTPPTARVRPRLLHIAFREADGWPGLALILLHASLTGELVACAPPGRAGWLSAVQQRRAQHAVDALYGASAQHRTTAVACASMTGLATSLKTARSGQSFPQDSSWDPAGSAMHSAPALAFNCHNCSLHRPFLIPRRAGRQGSVHRCDASAASHRARTPQS